MLLPSRSESVTIERILRVNHAGETGAIRIYAAQIAVARLFFPHIVPSLEVMRSDEVRHCALFRDAMPERETRPCRVMALWSLGGFVLGFGTAILGQRMVWICTEAVESTVHRHLLDQLFFLKARDPGLHAIIRSIMDEELAHLQEAIDNQPEKGMLHAVGIPVISALTETMIWLSTWGDTTWLRRELLRNGSHSDRTGSADPAAGVPQSRKEHLS